MPSANPGLHLLEYNVSDPDTRQFGYDPVTLQLETETLDGPFYEGHLLNRNHDTLGRSTGYTLNDSATNALSSVSYTYAATGRLATISDGTDAFTYAYENTSNLLASVEGPVHAVVHAYEPNRDLMTTVDNQVGASSVSKFTYRYDGVRRRFDRVDEGSAFFDWDYDGKGQVTAADRFLGTDPATPGASVPSQNAEFVYDEIGNRLTSTFGTEAQRTYTTNALHHYTTLTPSTTTPLSQLHHSPLPPFTIPTAT